MATVTGEMALLLDVLGRRQGDGRILEAIALLGPGMEVEEFDFDGETSRYYVFRPAGTDLLFENEVLVSAMVRTRPDGRDPGYGGYPRPAALIDGLAPTATRAEAAAFLGTPERTGPTFDRYEVHGRYLHVEFAPDGRIGRLSALLEPV
ncbi:hypothetical protein DFP74_2319 [Nocardiopsis sp. Huas11]|uniref:hypothetical protein n=1 Tax=Nocardiopsis sp. Huas11 TaxID=2183912 RepID=UPI000EAB9FC5|nr:hypothetical protein [Nocardiopsis sp. Huas11]RKS06676.1 hypothetical protein DFP74_2319 [Nocardiopsis sp. Huas11]